MDQNTMNMEKQKQAILNNDYTATMAEHDNLKLMERNKDLYNGMMANQRALKEEEYFTKAAQDKKEMIKQILKTGNSHVKQEAENVEGLPVNDKVMLRQKLELDNKLRNFNSHAQKRYESYTH